MTRYTLERDRAHWTLYRDGARLVSRTSHPHSVADALQEVCGALADAQADAELYRLELGQCVEAARMMDEWIAAKRAEVGA